MGISARRPTAGPEYELVESYVESQLPHPPRGQQRAIFIEPRIASGCPDIVVVYWHPGTARRWSERRADLTSFDLRVLHYMACIGMADKPQIQSVFTRSIGPTLERLYRADLIRYKDFFFEAMTLQRIFAVRRLIAIEAKIDDWRSGLAQALQNTWFASESYVLLSQLPRSSSLFHEAIQYGIGVVAHNQPLKHAEVPARPESLPKSYASWLFNEWVWRLYR